MNLRQAAQRALKAMEDGEYRADMIEFSDALIALRAALAEPQTTHWEGCEAVHPECKTELERKSDAIQRLWKERDELRALNAELVEALQGMIDCCPETRGTHNPHLAMARAALAKVEVSK